MRWFDVVWLLAAVGVILVNNSVDGVQRGECKSEVEDNILVETNCYIHMNS